MKIPSTPTTPCAPRGRYRALCGARMPPGRHPPSLLCPERPVAPGCCRVSPDPCRQALTWGPHLPPGTASSLVGRAPHSQLLLPPECLTQFPSTRRTLQVPLNFHLSCQAHAESPGLVCPVSKLLECSVSHGVVPVHRHLPIPVVSRVCILPSSESSLIVTRTFGGCSQATLTLNQSSGGLSGR